MVLAVREQASASEQSCEYQPNIEEDALELPSAPKLVIVQF
jgi:hypothetical protein